MSDCSYATFLQFLTYLYTDELKFQTDKDLRILISLAERFELIRLKKLCLDQQLSFAIDVPMSTLYTDFARLLNDQIGGKSSDITFIVEGHAFRLHKVILCSQDYFAAMFSGAARLKESQLSEIEASDISQAAFQIVIHYCYTWRFEEGHDIETIVETFEVT